MGKAKRHRDRPEGVAMLLRLRRKFVLINMVFAASVLLCVFAAVCVSTYRSARSDVDRTLEQALDERRGEQAPPAGQLPDDARRGETPPKNWMLYYTVMVNTENDTVTVLQSGAGFTDEELTAAAQKVIAGGKTEGRLREEALYYARRDVRGGTRVAFVEASYLTESIRRLLWQSAAIGAVSLLAFFAISVFLARWALRPVERAWLQQRRFVADASHELKTPLTVILANNNILLSHPEERVETQKQWLESTGEEAQHMRRLVDDLLFLAKSDAEERPPVREPVDLSDLVYSVLLPFEPVAYEKQVALEAQVAPDITVTGDPTALRQLVHILLDNACKYAGTGGRVVLTLERQAGSAVLRVSNTGTPIPPEDLPHVFERFYRADKARTREGGYGLGLAIAKSIMDRQGGSLTAASDAENGTVFTAVIPASRH